MDLAEALRRRRMVRHYTGAPVAPDALDRIVAAGLSAPSAGWAQGIAIVVVTDPMRIAAIAAACGEAQRVERGFDPWLSTAGAHLVICLEPAVYRTRYSAPDKDPGVLEAIPWWWVDGGTALMAMLLTAVAEGLAAGVQGGHRAAPIRPLLGIPDDVVLLGIVTVGHPAPDRRSSSLEAGPRPGRVHRERW
ncbi:MAG TPA: nitroreductase family protein [Acidimicrobiia bacterium]|nr:nitroreductase family protein [Acidimicrobiia bacterium]